MSHNSATANQREGTAHRDRAWRRLGAALAPAALAPAVLAPLLAPTAAHAETRDPFQAEPPRALLRDYVAGSRQFADTEPKGVAFNGLTLLPSLTLRTDADSNVLNRSAGKTADVYATLSPALTVRGTAGKARFSLSAEAGLARYAGETAQNNETAGVAAQGAVPLGGRMALALNGGWARRQEPNSSAGAAATAGGPSLFDDTQGALGLRADLGLTRVETTATITRLAYRDIALADGGSTSQAFRDTRLATLGARVEHGLPGGQIVFVQGAHTWTESLRPLSCCDRSGTGGTIMAVMRGQVSHLVEAELAAGWEARRYHAGTFRNWSGLAWRARIEWYATPLVSVALRARRDFVNSPLPAAAGVQVDSFDLRLFWEARRHLNVVVTATRAHEDYRDTGLAGRVETLGVEARRTLGSRYLLGASARYRNRTSASPLLPHQGSAVEGALWLRFSL